MLDSSELDKQYEVLSPRELNIELIKIFPQIPDPTDRTHYYDALNRNLGLIGDAFEQIDQTSLGNTPEERSAELDRRIFEKIERAGEQLTPQSEILRMKSNIDAQDRQRATSEEKLDLLVTYIKLLKRSQFSQSCQRYLTTSLANIIDSGVNKDEVREISGIQVPTGIGELMLLVKFNEQDPKSPGPFDHDLAEQIENEVYSHAVAHLRATAYLGLLASRVLRSSTPDFILGSFSNVPFEGDKNLINLVDASKTQLDLWAQDFERNFGYPPRELAA